MSQIGGTAIPLMHPTWKDNLISHGLWYILIDIKEGSSDLGEFLNVQECVFSNFNWSISQSQVVQKRSLAGGATAESFQI